MSRKDPARAILAMIAIGGLLVAGQLQRTAQADQRYSAPAQNAVPSTSKGLAAMDTAAREGKYLFVFFWKANDQQTQAMYRVFQTTMQKLAGSANSVGIPVTDPGEKPMVDKIGVGRAPMPLVVALAPNGAVTKAFPVRFTEQQLQTAFVSAGTARCMRALQHRKLVVLCVQNQQTRLSQAALQGARDFQADARFAQATEVVTIDPADQAETPFLQSLQVDPRTPTSVTVLLAPPGRPVARFAGAVTKDQISAKVVAAQSSCCAGGKCGPGGCGPKR